MQKLKVKSIKDILKDRTDEVVMVVRNDEGMNLLIRKTFLSQEHVQVPFRRCRGR